VWPVVSAPLHDCYCQALATTSIFSHIEHFTSASSPLLFPLVFAFTLAAHLKKESCVVVMFKVEREQLGAM
jgi:hypothetical protein